MALALCVPAGAHAQGSADLILATVTASRASIPQDKTTRVTYYLTAKNNGPDEAADVGLSLQPADLESAEAHTVVSIRSSSAAAECDPGEALPVNCKVRVPAGDSSSMAVTADVKHARAGKLEVDALVEDEVTPDPNAADNERRFSLGVGGSGSSGGGGETDLFNVAPTIARLVKPGTSLIAFSLTRPARVKFTVSKRVKGRRKGRRCVAGRRRGKRCKTYRAIGSITRSGVLGPQTVPFPSRVRGRRLRPGVHYLLTVQARDVFGVRSRVYKRKFRVRRA
jgi:hypothetical protein